MDSTTEKNKPFFQAVRRRSPEALGERTNAWALRISPRGAHASFVR
jgi:hypothetical protein